MAARRRGTLHDEWWADGFGVVLNSHGVLWYGYPRNDGQRLGPFQSRYDAQRELERTSQDTPEAQPT